MTSTLKSKSFLSSIRQTGTTISKSWNQGTKTNNFILAIVLFMQSHWDNLFMVVLTMFIAFTVFQIHGLNFKNLDVQTKKLSYTFQKPPQLFFPIPDDISFASIFQSYSIPYESPPDTSNFEFNIPE